jgi:predicted transcriptional regulator
MKSIEEYVAEWRARRKKAGIHAIEISRQSGLHFNTVYNILNGKTKNVEISTMQKIERTLSQLEKLKRKRKKLQIEISVI